MTQLEELVRAIMREYELARGDASRVALHYLQRAYEHGWEASAADLRAHLGDRVPALRADPNRIAFLGRYTFSAIRGIDDLAREKVAAVMKRAVDDPTLTVRDVAALLESELQAQIENWRVPVIARTEVNRSGNAAKFDRYAKTPALEYVEVSTAEDARVRRGPDGPEPSPADHAQLEGQVRKKGEPFHVVRVRGGPNDNGDRYPPFDPNCRCTLIPHFPQGKLAAKPRDTWHRAMRTYEDGMRLDMTRAYRSAFERVDALLRVRGPDALAAARRGP